jgi:hypothetical protein
MVQRVKQSTVIVHISAFPGPNCTHSVEIQLVASARYVVDCAFSPTLTR